jgi:hypothetical protein
MLQQQLDSKVGLQRVRSTYQHVAKQVELTA